MKKEQEIDFNILIKCYFYKLIFVLSKYNRTITITSIINAAKTTCKTAYRQVKRVQWTGYYTSPQVLCFTICLLIIFGDNYCILIGWFI